MLGILGGSVNYFTSDWYDAEANYSEKGPDLFWRMQEEKDRLGEDYIFELQGEIEGIVEESNLERIMRTAQETDQGVVLAEVGILQELKDAIEHNHGVQLTEFDLTLSGFRKGKFEIADFAEELSETIIERSIEQRFIGEKPHVKRVFVRLDNPVYLGGPTSSWIKIRDVEAFRDAAIVEIMEEKDLDKDADMTEYEDEIEDRAFELCMFEPNRLEEAIERAIYNNSDNVDIEEFWESKEGLFDESMISASQLEHMLRNNHVLQLAEDEEGNNVHNRIVAEVFRELGYDGIVLQNADIIFAEMDISADTAHIHIFEGLKTQIKSATDNQGTYSPFEPDIYKHKPEEEAQGEVVFTKNNTIVTLLKSADRSTFIHETSHIFLEDMRRLAGLTNAPQQVKADWDSILDFVGNSGEPITKAQHEKWARAFEAYLREGRAPSRELQTAFRRFKQWLTKLYETLRNLVYINDEIRGVDGSDVGYRNCD
jgi:hypothetical protein